MNLSMVWFWVKAHVRLVLGGLLGLLGTLALVLHGATGHDHSAEVKLIEAAHAPRLKELHDQLIVLLQDAEANRAAIQVAELEVSVRRQELTRAYRASGLSSAEMAIRFGKLTG